MTARKGRGDADPATTLEAMLRRPSTEPALAPCQGACPAGGDVRGWIQLIAQREKLGLTLEEACRSAWLRLVEANPLPATTGRICPHPCEQACNRSEKDGAVAVNSLERYLGDWALERGLPLPGPVEGPWPERVAVVGSGPAGLSFAYHAARLGLGVTIFERDSRPGGMLLRGVPEYRLPEDVLEAEIRRILDLGVELRLNESVGEAVSLAQLRSEFQAVFLGIGARAGRRLGVPGEDGEGCLTGTEYLRRVNEGRPPALGARAVIVGGGNTAVDAARAARRAGAEVVLVYRRTRDEMPAIPEEVDEAIEEGVALELLAAPVAVLRAEGRVHGLRVCDVRLGPPDATGRRRPVTVPDTERDVPADTVVVAVSQEPDWTGLEDVPREGPWTSADARGLVADGVWAGGDARGLGIASLAIGHGRKAAEAVHAQLRGREPDAAPDRPQRLAGAPRLSLYDEAPRAEPQRSTPEERLARPDAEGQATLGTEAFVAEAARCLSCGSCFGCQRCWMYCPPGGIVRLEEVEPGAYFAFDLGSCEGCGKCVEVCPCGFLSAG